MKRVFVDSGGFFALLVAEDASHRIADALFARAVSDRWRLATTNAVVFETYALLVNRVRNGRELAVRFLDELDNGFCHVHRVSPSDEKKAADLLRAHKDKTYSFCDALAFVVMQRLRIKDAIAFDRHFREYGRFTMMEA